MSEKRQSSATRAISNTGIIAAKALKNTGEHRATEAGFILLGVGLLLTDIYVLVTHPPGGTADQVFHGAWALVALALIPGAATRTAAGIGKIGGAVADAWKKKQ